MGLKVLAAVSMAPLTRHLLPGLGGWAGSAGAGLQGPGSLWERRSPCAQSSRCAWMARPGVLAAEWKPSVM